VVVVVVVVVVGRRRLCRRRGERAAGERRRNSLLSLARARLRGIIIKSTQPKTAINIHIVHEKTA